MRQTLKLHANSFCDAVTKVDVDVALPHAGSLVLHYTVTGRIADLRLPPVTTPKHTDELWRHTCFEAFVRPTASTAYFELNFSPSTQWAAYQFDRYRSGMRVATEVSALRIEARSSHEHYALQATLELDQLPDLRRDARWCLGLSTVIEETNGRTSYWALAHPPGKPDFHHSDCFVLELSPT